MKNAQVAKFWHANTPAKSRNGNFHTNGNDLYSYKLRIGYTDGYGQKVLYNYSNASGCKFISSATSAHINLSIFYADIIVKTGD